MAPIQKNPSSKSKESSTIHHPTHPKHPLEEVTNDTEYSCDGCHTSGVGTRYHCSICSFDLHEHCAKCPDKLSSYVHPRHALVLENKVSIDRFCDVCGDLVNGLFYSCEECEIDIHPICTLFPLNAKHDLHHQHVLRLQPAKPGWCVACREICNFWRYRCNTCCIDVHPNCLSTGSSDRGSGVGGSATGILQPPHPADNKVPTGNDSIQVEPQQATQPYPPVRYAGDVPTGDGTTRVVIQQTHQPYPPVEYVGEVPTSGNATREVIQQASQPYPSRGYAGEVPNSGVAMHTQPPTTSYPVAGHAVGVLNSGGSGGLASQGVPHQTPQPFPMAGYGVDVLTAAGNVNSPRKGILNQTPQTYPPSGYTGEVLAGGGRTQSHIGGLASQEVPYQAQQSYPVAAYGVDVLNAGGSYGSPRKGIPHQPPQSYPVSRNASEVLTTAPGSGSRGIPQPQAEVPTSYSAIAYGVGLPQGGYPIPQLQAEAPMFYPPPGYGVGLPQGGYPMPIMMNPGFPMGMGMGMSMMMAQPPKMVIVHQNYPGQGNNLGTNQKQQQGNQGNKQKKNEELEELAQMGKDVKKKMQFAAKYAMGLASAASTSLAGAPANVANLMKK